MGRPSVGPARPDTIGESDMNIGNATRRAIVIGVLTVCGAAPADAGTLPVTLIGQWDGFGGTYADL